MYFPADHIPAGQTVIGWKDNNGKIWKKGDILTISLKEMPLSFEAVFGSPEVTYRFNSNYTGGPAETTSVKADRFSSMTMPDYQKYHGYKGKTYGVFADENTECNNVPESDFLGLWYRMDKTTKDVFAFCGWSAGYQFPVLTALNYEENLSKIQSATIIQPGDTCILEDDDVTFYAVWAAVDAENAIEDKILAVCYQWGDYENCNTLSGYDDTYVWDYNLSRNRTYNIYLVDNIRADNVTNANGSCDVYLTLPSVSALFPQFDDLPVAEGTAKKDQWNGKSYLAAGDETVNTVKGGLENQLIFTYEYSVRIPVVEIHSNGNLYCGGTDKCITVYAESFPFSEVQLINPQNNSNWPEGFMPVAIREGTPIPGLYTFSDYICRQTGKSIFEHGSSYFDTDNYILYVADFADEFNASYPLQLDVEWDVIPEQCGAGYYIFSLDHVVYYDEVYDDEKQDTVLQWCSDESFEDWKKGINNEEDIYLVKNLTIDKLSEPLCDFYNSRFNGLGNCIEVKDADAPLFRDIGSFGGVYDLVLKGDFSTYTEPERDFGVFCSNNYGEIIYCSFLGQAPASTGADGKAGVFGYTGPSAKASDNTILSGTTPSRARDYSTMYQITMIPITGRTVSESVGSGAFASAGTAPVAVGNFLIAEAEVTYAQWRDVYTWAIQNGYTFNHQGREGKDGTENAEPGNGTLPVTTISYVDAVVWCNAASEKEGLTPVYYTTGNDVIRKVDSATNAVQNAQSVGYRLPEQKEWEYAARGGDPDADAWKYTYAGSNNAQEVAVYYSTYINGSSGTKYSAVAHVKTLKPNTAGLYDMSGNAGEFFFKKDTGNCFKSSSENQSDSSKVDYSTDQSTSSTDDHTGFRVVRSIIN